MDLVESPNAVDYDQHPRTPDLISSQTATRSEYSSNSANLALTCTWGKDVSERSQRYNAERDVQPWHQRHNVTWYKVTFHVLRARTGNSNGRPFGCYSLHLAPCSLLLAPGHLDTICAHPFGTYPSFRPAFGTTGERRSPPCSIRVHTAPRQAPPSLSIPSPLLP